eukprot:scaffold297037_cov30-Attheya_sp.AAC.1
MARVSHCSRKARTIVVGPTVAYRYGMVVITSSLYPSSVHHLSPKRKARAFVVPVPPPLYGTYPGTGREGRQTDRRWIEWSGGSST